MKKLLLIILSMVMSLVVTSPWVSAWNINETCEANVLNKDWQDKSTYVTSGIYTYRVINEESKEIEIRDINSSSKVIKIPKKIDGYNVVSIGYCEDVYSYFVKLYPDYEENLYSARLIEDATDIDALKLGGCQNTLKKLVIPGSVRNIGPCAFYGFKSLTEVVLNKNLKVMQGKCFGGCSSLKKINIPANTAIGESAFVGCKSIKEISINQNNVRYCEELFDRGSFDVVRLKGISYFDNTMFGYGTKIKKLVIDGNVRKFHLDKWHVKELVVKNKKTEIICDTADESITDKYNKFKVTSVKKAKAIKFARKNKLKYHVVKRNYINKM